MPLRWEDGSLTYTGVPPEDVPVKDVERKMPEATWDLAVEVLAIERTAQRSHKPLIRHSHRVLSANTSASQTECFCHKNPFLLL